MDKQEYKKTVQVKIYLKRFTTIEEELEILLEEEGETSASFAEILDPMTLSLVAVAIIATIITMKIVGRLLSRSISKHNGSKHAEKTTKKISKITISLIGFAVVLGILGIPISAIGTFLGLIGLGLSFALREIIANFISGMLILTTRPFKIGDQIEVKDEAGTVEDIRLRATDIRTFDGRKVIVPNSDLYNKTVVNNTGYSHRRFDVIVGIGYEEDIKTAKDLAMAALDEAENVEDDPEPQVLVDELGDSSVNLRLRGWTNTGRASVVKASSELTHLIKDKYDEKDIDIPYPVRTVYMSEN